MENWSFNWNYGNCFGILDDDRYKVSNLNYVDKDGDDNDSGDDGIDGNNDGDDERGLKLVESESGGSKLALARLAAFAAFTRNHQQRWTRAPLNDCLHQKQPHYNTNAFGLSCTPLVISYNLERLKLFFELSWKKHHFVNMAI